MATFEQSAKTSSSASLLDLSLLMVASLRHWLSVVQRPASRALPIAPMNVEYSASAFASQALGPTDGSLPPWSLSSRGGLAQHATNVRRRRPWRSRAAVIEPMYATPVPRETS